MQLLTITGVIDGANATFTLSRIPLGFPAVVRNGLLQTPGADYNLAGVTVTFLAGAIPAVGDSLLVFAGDATDANSGIGVPLSTLILPAYRIAGLIPRSMLAPNVDMFAEAIPELNRMIGGWNCRRPNIFTVRVDAFNISGGTKIFYVGAGATAATVNGVSYGSFDMPRPQEIQNGVIGLGPAGTNGLVRMPPMSQLDDNQWANISLQEIPNGVPLSFYYDGSYDPLTGWGLIYLWTQTTMSYSVEWYTWQAIPTFQTKDDVVSLPPGYEDAIVYNLAARLAALDPERAHMAPESYVIARRSLTDVQSKNAVTPTMESDYPGTRKLHWDYRIGAIR